MAKTTIEKITSVEEQIRQLENQRKLLLQQHKEQERKDRTKRLCKRMGLLESMLPDTILLSDEQFKTFLEKAVANDYGRRMLATITAQNTATSTVKSAGMTQESGTATSADEDNGTRVSG